MSEPAKAPGRAEYEAVFNQLLKAGWVTEFGFHGPKFGAKWTDKGKKQMGALMDICQDADIQPRQILTLVLIGLLTNASNEV